MGSELTTEYWALEELPQKLVLKQNVWNCPQRGAGGQFPGLLLHAAQTLVQGLLRGQAGLERRALLYR